MNREAKKLILIALGIAIVLAGTYWYRQAEKKSEKRFIPYYGIDTVLIHGDAKDTVWHTVSDFRFTNQLGEKVNINSVKGKVYVADYIFTTCPGICKEMSDEMTHVYKAFENEPDFVILSHTSKPQEDSISVLMTYAKKYGVTDHHKWQMLTGTPKELYRMAASEYFIIDETDHDESFVHTELLALIDKKGHIRGYYDGTQTLEVNKLMKDIKYLLAHE